MAAQVVAPVVVADIAGRTGEGNFIGQCAPGRTGIARETDWVAVAAQAAPAVINDGAKLGTVASHILEEDVVDPERLA